MELELGLKITRTRDDLTSTTDLRVTKDPSGPVFVSKEIDTMFILEGHLKGIRRENIDIDINKDGDRIAISGKKPVQEMVLMGWIMHKKEVVMRTFKRSFRIPDGVKVDKIRAKFNDETSILTIRMPKWVKGISGVGIEEVEEEKVGRGKLEATQTVGEKVPESERGKEVPQESEQPTTSGKIDQIEARQPQWQNVVADEIPEKGTGLEALKEETLEQKVRGKEQAIDQGLSEAAKIPEGDDDNKEMVKEKPEENKEEMKSRKLEDAAKAEPERVQEPGFKEPKEGEVNLDSSKSREDNDQVVEKPQGRPESELQGVTEKVKIPTRKEISSTEPKEEAERETDRLQTVGKPSIEETRKENIPEESASEKRLEEHVNVPESIQSAKSTDDRVIQDSEFPSSSSTQVEEKHKKPEELQQQEPCIEDRQLTKPEPYQEPKADDHTIEEEVHGEDQTQADETKETPNHEENPSQEKVDELECQELENQKSSSEDAGQGKKPVPRKPKVCTPIIVAGSAFLVSIIMLVIHLIRAKKR